MKEGKVSEKILGFFVVLIAFILFSLIFTVSNFLYGVNAFFVPAPWIMFGICSMIITLTIKALKKANDFVNPSIGFEIFAVVGLLLLLSIYMNSLI